MIPFGIDVGASDVKVVSAPEVAATFPSAAVPYKDIGELMGRGTFGRIRILSGRKALDFYVGELATIHGHDVPTIQGQYRVEGNATLALYLAAISEGLTTDHRSVDVGAVVGVPASMAQDAEAKARLVKMLEGTHHIEMPEQQREIDVMLKVLQVMSQPNGTAFGFLTDWFGKQDTSVSGDGQIAVLDIGGETTDVTRMTNVVIDRSGSLKLGMRAVENAIAESVKAQYGIELDWLGRRNAITKREVYVDGERRDISAMVKASVERISETMIRFFLSTLNSDGKELRYILVTGGGARAMYPHIAARFPQARLMQTPEFSNAVGFYKKARRLL